MAHLKKVEKHVVSKSDGCIDISGKQCHSVSLCQSVIVSTVTVTAANVTLLASYLRLTLRVVDLVTPVVD